MPEIEKSQRFSFSLWETYPEETAKRVNMSFSYTGIIKSNSIFKKTFNIKVTYDLCQKCKQYRRA